MTEFNYRKDSKEQMPYEHYMELYKKADPQEICSRLEIPYDESTHSFAVKLLGTVYHVTWPDYEITHEENAYGYYPLEDMIYAKILVLRYLLESKKAIRFADFKTFRELPWGEVYQQQFHGRCILRLAYGFGNKPEQFKKIGEVLGGIPLKYGDVSFELELFDGYRVRFIIWEGDEEFPPSSQILFSDNFADGFSAEDRVVTGDVCIGTFKALSKTL